MNIAIITAGGIGKRMGSGKNKVFMLLDDKPIIYHTIKAFEDSKLINKSIIVTGKDDLAIMKRLVKEFDFRKVVNIVEGGKFRQDSVYCGLKAASAIAKNSDIIVINNGCNPFVSQQEIEESIKNAKKHGASVCAVRVKDTLKKIKAGFVEKTVERELLWLMQTPQTMKFGIAMKAFDDAYQNDIYATDDVGLVERIGVKVKIVPSSYRNFKITTKDDLAIAKCLTGRCNETKVGIGEDSHAFSKTKKELWLGGIRIPGCDGFEAQSDGDVVLHSLFNAVSSALGKRSIGHYFSNKDKRCKNARSAVFFRKIDDILKKSSFRVNNVSISVEAKKPKIQPYIEEMKAAIANLLKINKDSIGITATSGEGLTSFGKGLGVKAVCYVSLAR